MRDYFIHPAQTNLELYAQAIDHGYSKTQRRRLGDAYVFAFRQVFPLARGSGKPFIAHLVGTASLVLESGCPEDWVLGGLFHALYQRRVPFEGHLLPDDRRCVLKERFGNSVDDLVYRYTSFETENLRDFDSCKDGSGSSDVLTLRLADELEDLSGNSLALHGSSEPDEDRVFGGYASRREMKIVQAPSLLALTQSLDLHGMHEGFLHWLDFESSPQELEDMRTGWLSSVNLATGVHA